jgi:hypothetical protein
MGSKRKLEPSGPDGPDGAYVPVTNRKVTKVTKAPKVQITKETPRVFDITEIAEAAEFMRSNGFVVVKAGFSQEVLDECILENFRASVLDEPGIKPEHRLVVRCPATKRPLDIGDPGDRATMLRVLKSPLDRATREDFTARWCMHRGFGACCNPAVFHLPSVWKVREALYPVARALTGTEALWVDVNRSIQKLQGQGEEEFLHWDCDPLAPFPSNGPDGNGPEDAQASQTQASQICGKFVYTTSRFVCVPGTHTEEFARLFAEHYASLYPNAQPNTAKFGLDPTKSDPLVLFAKQREFSVPEGCAVFWHPRLLHGQTKTPLDEPIEFGMYVGYFAAGSRPEYLDACGATELDDRIGSFTEGRAPKLWPSFDPVHFYPKRWQNFPSALETQIARRTGPSVTTRVTKSGKTVPHLVPVPDPHYVPPVLSLTGMRLLGLVAY